MGHKKYIKPFAALLALLVALSGCSQPAEPVETPAPTQEAEPVETADNQTDDSGNLPLPEGYLPLTMPFELESREIRHYEFEDYAYPEIPALDLRDLQNRLWPQGGYEAEQQGDGKAFTLTAEDGSMELLYYDDHYAMFERYGADLPPLMKGEEELRMETESFLTILLGSDVYFMHPQQTDDTFYLRNHIEPVENARTFIYDQMINGISVEDHYMTVTAGEDGVSAFALRRGILLPTEEPFPKKLLTSEEALFSLNHARSIADDSAALSQLTRIVHAEMVFSHRFTERPSLFRPAFKFVLTGADYSMVDTVFVDAATGDIYSDYDGYMDSAYPELSSRSMEMAKSGIDPAEAEALLREFIETAWNSLYSMTVPELPDFAMKNSENAFNYHWAELQIELIRRRTPKEQAKTPPSAAISVGESNVDGIEVRVPYDCTVSIDREEGDAEVSFQDNAVFVFRNGRWMLKSAGLIWNGPRYEDVFFALWHDGPLSVAKAAVRREIMMMDDPFWPGEIPDC